jgi:hypothetical protein
LLLYWGYIVTFPKVLTICHSWIHLSTILLYLSSPHSWNSFNRCHFYTWVHSISTIFTLLHPFLLSFPLPLASTPRQDLFYLSVLCFWKKNDNFICFK